MYTLLLFLVFYLPFQLALNPSAGIDLASGRILIIILFLAWITEGLKNKKIIIRQKLAGGLLLSFLFLNLISVVVAKNSDWSVRKLLFLFSLLPLYFVGQAILDSTEKKQKIIQWLVYGAFLSAWVGILQFVAQFVFGMKAVYQFWADYVAVPFLGKSFSEAVLQNPSWLVNVSGETYLRATAFFPDPHMFSFFLGLVIPLAIGMLVIFPQKKILNSIIVLSLLVADILTFSRGGYLGLLAGFVFLLVIFWQKIAKKYQIAVMALAVGIVVLSLIPSPINQRFASIFNLKEGSNQGRIETWKKALDVIGTHPLIGVGIGNYPLEIKATADYREPIYAHNAYLDIAAESGIFNAFLWISFLGLTIVGLYQSKNKILIFASVSVVIFAVHSLVETGIYSTSVLPIFLIISSLNNEN